MGLESTQAAVEISAADSDMATDLSCKRVLALKVILAPILQKVVKEYHNYTPEEIAEKFIDSAEIELFREVSPGMTNRKESMDNIATESGVPGEAKVFFDLNIKAFLPDEYRTPTKIVLHIDVEAQREYRPGYPLEKRGIYYISRMISSQMDKVGDGSGYARLQKVYSIWICLGRNIPQEEQQTITRFRLVKEDIVGQVDVNEDNYDLLELIMIRLGNKHTDDKLLGMLTTLLWEKLSTQERMRKLEDEYGIPMKREVVEEVGRMCTYSAAIREWAMEEGLAEGRAKGLAEGRAEAICVLLESMGELSNEIKARILAEQDSEVLNQWLKETRKVDTIAEFCEMVQL